MPDKGKSLFSSERNELLGYFLNKFRALYLESVKESCYESIDPIIYDDSLNTETPSILQYQYLCEMEFICLIQLNQKLNQCSIS